MSDNENDYLVVGDERYGKTWLERLRRSRKSRVQLMMFVGGCLLNVVIVELATLWRGWMLWLYPDYIYIAFATSVVATILIFFDRTTLIGCGLFLGIPIGFVIAYSQWYIGFMRAMDFRG